MQSWRIKLVQLITTFVGLVVAARLFYWQILSKDKLQAIAEIQQTSTVEIPGSRGKILAADGYPLVANQPAYLLYAYLPQVEKSPKTISETLAPLLAPRPEDIDATPSAEVKEALEEETRLALEKKLSTTNLAWVPLHRQVTEVTKVNIEKLHLAGVGFEVGEMRLYPEASMAAQLVGFVGKDAGGAPKGYFGLEGYYDLELKGKPGLIRQEKDASGKPIVIGNYQDIESRDGRSLKTYLDRSLQLVIEKKLKDGLEKYQAASGEVLIMDPKTGGILAAASLPSFDPERYQKYDSTFYKLPSISNTYEPGSTFKVLVMAAALEENRLKPEDTCESPCAGPVKIGAYTIRTWNNEYNPGQTMTQILEHSDNVGMVYVAQKLGKDKFIDYIKKFGIGSPTNIDLEGETAPTLRDRWGDIDLATGAFGQGLAVTSIQMLSAVAAIANDGVRLEPHVVQAVIGEKEIPVPPVEVGRIVSKKTADTVTEMMVSAVKSGEARWTYMKGYNVAGKTGTAQIPISGHYDTDKTIASFVGFAPADDPKFAMLVKLREPQSSPWAAETAAPLWMGIARDLFYHFNLAPSQN